MTQIRPVILAGGSGTRLAPLSGPHKPKQFLSLLEDDTPFQDTLERVSDEEFLPPLIIAAERYRDIIEDQCDEIDFPFEDLLLEANGCNTGPACLSAALWAQARNEDYPLLICPSDHFIADQSAFMRAVGDAALTAEQGYIVTFGVIADRAETQYGYIEVGNRLHAGFSGHKVERFIEKPAREQAATLLKHGRYVWNAGIFCTTPKTLIEEMARLSPDHSRACTQAFETITDGVLHYPDCPAQSLDVAVLEKSDRVGVVSLLTAWSDLGTWPGVWKALSLI